MHRSRETFKKVDVGGVDANWLPVVPSPSDESFEKQYGTGDYVV
jgi:hypothetical protein